MPQWAELPPNLVPCAATNGKTIYQTDFSSRRPGFQIHLQKAARGTKNFHHPRLPKEPSRSSLRASQTGGYMSFKEEYDKNLAAKTGRTAPSIPRTPETPGAKDKEIYREILSEYIKPSLDLARQAWKNETSAVNRDRERMYGLAGKKVDIVPRPPRTGVESKKSTTKVLPGMKNWLNKSNEYEKAVVCNFMDHVAKASTKQTHVQPVITFRPKPPQPQTTTARPKTAQPSKPKFTNEYFYKQQRAKSAHSQRVSAKFDLPPRPKTVHSFRNEENEGGYPEDEVVEEPMKEHGHGHHTHHTEGKCEFCDYLRVKQLLDYLNGNDAQLGEGTLRHLLRPRYSPTYGYPAYEDYDYIHENSFFSNTTARDRGYFIIAPDWVSERKGIPLPKHRG